MKEEFSAWLYNVKDRFKPYTKDQIAEIYKAESKPFAVLMLNLSHDFNIGSVIRSANSFGAREFFYYGSKKWDRRAAVGSYHYFEINYLKEKDQLLSLKDRYSFVALEQNSRSIPLQKFEWPKNPLIVIGEEGTGIPDEYLELCDDIIEIPSLGTIRSLNAASAASIAMYDWTVKNG